MSNVRYVFPKPRLTDQLRVPGGVAVAEALEAAEANLAQLRPQCLEELESLTAEAEACFERLPSTFSGEVLLELYAIAARGVGAGSVCGQPAADAALISLCDLLDHLRRSERLDREAVGVHVMTLRLLVRGVSQPLPAGGAERLVSDLKKVSARFARPPAG